MADPDDRADSLLGKLSLDNRLVFFLAAVVLGVGGNQVLIRAAPDTVRPDPWTGKLAQSQVRRILEVLDLRLRPHEDHLARAGAGWDQIYEMREDIAEIKVWMRERERVRGQQ